MVWCGVRLRCGAKVRGREGKGREEMDGASFMINKSSMESIADVIASQLCWMMSEERSEQYGWLVVDRGILFFLFHGGKGVVLRTVCMSMDVCMYVCSVCMYVCSFH